MWGGSVVVGEEGPQTRSGLELWCATKRSISLFLLHLGDSAGAFIQRDSQVTIHKNTDGGVSHAGRPPARQQ